jgi:hypothetical protein
MAKNNKTKNAFLVSVDQIDGMKNISDEQFREVIMAMLEIDRGNEPVIADPIVDFIVNSKKGWAVENRDSWQKECDRRAAASRENGKSGGRPKNETQETQKTSDIDIDYDIDKEQEHEHEHDNNNGKIVNKVEKPAIAIAPADKNKRIKYEIDFSRNYGSWPEMEAELRKLYPDFSLDTRGADFDFSKLPKYTIYSRDWLNFLAGIHAESSGCAEDIDVNQIAEKYGGKLINDIDSFLFGCERSARDFAAKNRAKEKRKR